MASLMLNPLSHQSISEKNDIKIKDIYLISVEKYISQCYIAVKRHHDQGSSYKRKQQLELVYSFRGLVHYHHGRKHGSTQEDVIDS